MNQEKQIILIIEAKDGSKYQGNFVSKDTEKLVLILSNVTKTFEGKEEKMDSCELKKEDIAKISMIDNTQKKDEIENVHQIPDNKNQENSLDNVQKAYDKSKDFFDNMTTTLNKDMKKVAKDYNKKNADTFKLQGNEDHDGGNNNRNRGMNRGRGYGRGRYRNNRGGFNRQNKYDNVPGNNMNNFNNQFYNYQNGNRNRGNMNNRGQRGNNYRGRGNRYYKNNNIYRGNAQINNNN